MVSPVVAQAILGLQPPDIVGAFEKGRTEARAEQARTVAGEIAGGKGGAEQYQRLAGLDPELALKLQDLIGARSEKDLDNFIRSAGITRRMLESGDTAGALDFANQRLAILESQGRDTTHTRNIRDRIASGDTAGALAELTAFDDSLAKANTALQVQSSQILDDGTAIQVMKDGSTRVVSPSGRELSGQARADAIRKAQEYGVSLAEERGRAGRRSVQEEADRTRAIKQQEESQKLATKAFEQLGPIRKNILNIDRAIGAIDKGADTGFVADFFPSIQAASIELDNLRNQMGLDVISSVTFGALSEAELKMALDTALPTNLDEKELKVWLQNKKEAQQKVAKALADQAKFFSRGGTIEDLIKRDEQLQAGQAGQGVTPPPATLPAGGGQIKILGVRRNGAS